MTEEINFDYIVVGGGIAGICAAEMLSRESKSVLLLERSKMLAGEASSEHHGWFHMGSLYSIFWKNHFQRTLIGGIEDLIEHYSIYDNMNLFIDDDGSLKVANNKDGWFHTNEISYLVACYNDSDFWGDISNFRKRIKMLCLSIGWHFYVRKFIGRHIRFKNYKKWSQGLAAIEIPNVWPWEHDRSVIQKLNDNRLYIAKETHIKLNGFDRTLSAQKICSDIVDRYYKQGGKVLVNTEVTEVHQNVEKALVYSQDKTFSARKVVLAAGKNADNISLDGKLSLNFKKTVSPLLVVYPALLDDNFVRLTPFVDKTINHMCHSINGVKYSVIGGGYYANHTCGEKKKAELEKQLFDNAKKVFGDRLTGHRTEIYWGTKTEFIRKTENRNYQYNINEEGPNIISIVPGKFSLGFSLAVNLFKLEFSKIPPRKPLEVHENIDYEGKPNIKHQKHALIVSKWLDE